MKFSKILAKRKTSDAANAGFLAGLVAGLVQAFFDLLTIILFKETVLKEFVLLKKQFGILIPYNVDTLYLIVLLTAPPAMVFLYLIAGIFFGLIFDKFKRKTNCKAVGLSLLFGFGFGTITNLPVSRLLIIAANIGTWLLFALLFSRLYHRSKREKEREQRENKAVIVFLLLLFILSFSITLLCYHFRVKLISLAPLYMFIPLVATLVTCYLYKIPLTSLGLSIKPNKWYVIAWLLPAFLAFFSLAISLLFPGTSYSANLEGLSRYSISPNIHTPLPPLLYFLLLGLIAGPTINTLFAFGEEIGWRGFLQKELNHLGFWKYSLLIGIVWGIWHAPLIIQGYNYPQHPIVGVFFMVIFCIAISPIFSYIRMKSKSVIAAAIMHGSLNAFAGIPIAFAKGSDLIVGLQGLSGFIVLIVIDFWLLVKADF